MLLKSLASKVKFCCMYHNLHSELCFAGTRSHYHYRVLRRKDLARQGHALIRWLPCPCSACMDRQWADCCNKEWVGGWTAVVMRALDSRGLNAHKPDRHLHSEKTADQLMQELCMCVAVFTCVDTRGHRFWLARPVQSPEIVPANQPFTCSLSEVKFNPGERIMKVQWYERLDGHSSVFEFRPDLGDFYSKVALIRFWL